MDVQIEYVEKTRSISQPQSNPNDESTAFTSYFGSEFDKTTVTHPGQRVEGSSSNQDSLPAEVFLCGVITENYEEV